MKESRFDRWMQRHLGGHISIGPLVVYGYNAMHVAVNLRCFGTYVCFHPTWKVFGHWWPWNFYISRDATPHAAAFRIGPGLWP